ncbi:NUDIX hydrolase [Azospirillum sp. sgz301742]
MTVIVEPRPAASVILLRDGAQGLELFMIERNAGLRFAAGATVFPGGCVDSGDHAAEWERVCRASPPDLPHRIAAIRETFEECGVLLARGAESQTLLDHAPTAETADFATMVRAAKVELATDALVPFARWVTPELVRRRFDTLFFLAPAPAGQRASVDGGEAVAGLWSTPRAVLAAAEAGRLRLIFATRLNLMRLAACATVAEAVAEAGRRPWLPILPRLVETAAGPVFRIPEGVGYSPTEFAADQVRLG